MTKLIQPLDQVHTPQVDIQNFAILDLKKSLNDRWAMYFTEGTFNFNGVTRHSEPGVIRIRPGDYDDLEIYNVYYNSLYDIYDIRKDPGCLINEYMMGGFMIDDCNMRFVINPNACEKYLRAFSDDFNVGFEKESGVYNSCKKQCTTFNFQYSNEYNNKTDCKEHITSCDLSIGGVTATEYDVPDNLLYNCHIAKDEDGIWDSDCVLNVGGPFAKSYIVNNDLEPDCHVAKDIP